MKRVRDSVSKAQRQAGEAWEAHVGAAGWLVCRSKAKNGDLVRTRLWESSAAAGGVDTSGPNH